MKLLSAMLCTVMMLFGCAHTHRTQYASPQVVLWDVQGLFGGRDVWISPSGRFVYRIVVPPGEGQRDLQESRYEDHLSQQEVADLSRLLERHRFFQISTADRYGIPDEARPTIFVTSGGRSHVVSKWAGDSHSHFDPVYQHLIDLVDSASRARRLYQGDLERDWRPEGFPDQASVTRRALPNL